MPILRAQARPAKEIIAHRSAAKGTLFDEVIGKKREIIPRILSTDFWGIRGLRSGGELRSSTLSWERVSSSKLGEFREICFSRSNAYLWTQYLDTHLMPQFSKIECLGSKGDNIPSKFASKGARILDGIHRGVGFVSFITSVVQRAIASGIKPVGQHQQGFRSGNSVQFQFGCRVHCVPERTFTALLKETKQPADRQTRHLKNRPPSPIPRAPFPRPITSPR